MSTEQQPVPTGTPAAADGGNGMGVAGFVTGLLGLVFFWFWPLGLVLGILGLVLGGIGRSRARTAGRGAGLATAGVVLGAIAVVLIAVLLIVAATTS